MKTPFSFKKKDEEKEAKLNRQMTANEFVNVKDIKNEIVYTKDGHLFLYIKIQPLSRDLLSKKEDKLIGKQFTSEFSALKCQYKFLSVSRPVDVSFMLDNFQRMKLDATERKRKEILTQKMRELNRFTFSGDVLEHQFFMITWVKDKKGADIELLKQGNDIISRFSSCGVNATICGEKDSVKLFNLFANPNYAHLEDEDYMDNIPYVH